jgi:hypothetical protein
MESVPYDLLHACGSLILREEQPHRSALCATAYTGTACHIRIHAKRVVRYATVEAGGIVFATLRWPETYKVETSPLPVCTLLGTCWAGQGCNAGSTGTGRKTAMGSTTETIKKGIKDAANTVKRGAEKGKAAAVRGVDKAQDAAARGAEKGKEKTDRATEKVKDA